MHMYLERLKALNRLKMSYFLYTESLENFIYQPEADTETNDLSFRIQCVANAARHCFLCYTVCP